MRRSCGQRDRPYQRSRAVCIALAALFSFGAIGDAAAEKADAAQPFDLLGTWYLVVHYTEATDATPASDAAGVGRQWEDKVWTFEYRGSRLLWTEYPVVVFEDDRGRNEFLASGRSMRSSGSWQPSATQLAEIARGLSVNPLAVRSKSLRGDPARGFRSIGSLNTTSASVIGYSETWEIADLVSEPVFRRIDQMSSGRSLPLAGKTEYLCSASTAAGARDRLVGSFSRDGVQTGSFVMIRSGSIAFADPEVERDKWKH
jgi:hypothetical protein